MLYLQCDGLPLFRDQIRSMSGNPTSFHHGWKSIHHGWKFIHPSTLIHLEKKEKSKPQIFTNTEKNVNLLDQRFLVHTVLISMGGGQTDRRTDGQTLALID